MVVAGDLMTRVYVLSRGGHWMVTSADSLGRNEPQRMEMWLGYIRHKAWRPVFAGIRDDEWMIVARRGELIGGGEVYLGAGQQAFQLRDALYVGDINCVHYIE
jgi:hypothetical protein